jgi:hypothetical protein
MWSAVAEPSEARRRHRFGFRAREAGGSMTLPESWQIRKKRERDLRRIKRIKEDKAARV